MNKTVVASLMMAFGTLVFNSLSAQSADPIQRPHNWTMTIETQRLSRQFQYQGSNLNPVEKANIGYFYQTDENNKVAYEYIWFHDGRPLGLERLHKLELAPGDGIAINITHKQAGTTLAECKAAADALVHLVLDAYINKNSVAIVNVPAESFADLTAELQSRHHFQAQADNGANNPVASGINIFVQSVPAGNSTTLYYF